MFERDRGIPVGVLSLRVIRVESLAILGHQQNIVLEGRLTIIVRPLPHPLLHCLEVDGVLYDIVVPRGVVPVDGANVRPGPGLVLDLPNDLQERSLDVLRFLRNWLRAKRAVLVAEIVEMRTISYHFSPC